MDDLWTARANYNALAASLAWSILNQPMDQSFFAHVSYQRFAKRFCCGPWKQAPSLLYSGLSYAVQICTAVGIWVYWTVPGLNTSFHIAVLAVWLTRVSFNRFSATLYPLTTEHYVFRMVMDVLVWCLGATLILLVLVEICIQPGRNIPELWIVLVLFLPAWLLDTLLTVTLYLFVCTRSERSALSAS